MGLRTVLYLVAAPVLDRLWTFLSRSWPSEVVGSIAVRHGDGPPKASRTELIAKALKIVRLASPIWYLRVQRNVRRIIVAAHRSGQGAEYHRSSRTIVVQAEVIDAVDADQLAALLVHEATHGCLEERGVVHMRFHPRAERLCVKNEVRFLKLIDANPVWVSLREELLLRSEHRGTRGV